MCVWDSLRTVIHCVVCVCVCVCVFGVCVCMCLCVYVCGVCICVCVWLYWLTVCHHCHCSSSVVMLSSLMLFPLLVLSW